jgi:hypothetical protein
MALYNTCPDPDTAAAYVATRTHEGFRRAERHPCHCRFCGGAIAPLRPHGALTAAATMRRSLALLVLLLCTGPVQARMFIDPVYSIGGVRCQQHARGPEAAAVLELVGLPARHGWSATLCTAADGTVMGRFVDRRGRVVCDVLGVYDQERGCFDSFDTFCADGTSVARSGLCG